MWEELSQHIVGALVAHIELELFRVWVDSVHIFAIPTKNLEGEHIVESAVVFIGVHD
jgi:hypothetical protein